MVRRRNKSEERDIAERRIERLLVLARGKVAADPARADRYGALALRVAQKYQTGLSASAKTQLCRKCGAQRNTKSSRVRLHANRLITTCLRCGDVRRRPLTAKPASDARNAPTTRPGRAA